MVQAGDFKVVFKHETNISKERKRALTSLFHLRDAISGITICYIEKEGEIVERGYSFCNVKDIFNKEKGRQVALSRATYRLSKEDRKLIHDAYNNRKPDLSNKVLVKGEWYDEDYIYDIINLHG